MKRYYLCDIYGNGDPDAPNTPTTGAYRPAVADKQVSWVGVITTGVDGRPAQNWALVLVATNDHAALRNVGGVDPLPDFPLDGKVSAINQASRAALSATLTRRGLSSSLVDGKDGYREVIRAIGQTLEPAFSEDKFDISDV